LPSTSPRTGHPDELQFSDRDAEVLRLLGQEELMAFTFEGLRRKMGTHSETLSRILHRLEEQMILEKTPDGYHITHKGKEVMGVKPLATSSSPSSSTSQHRVAILHTLLPYGRGSKEAASGLKGRWFGPLRWLGYSEDERGTTLKWVTGDGAVQIDAIFAEGELTIEGNVREGKDLTDAIRASYQLVGHLSRFNPTSNANSVAFFTLGSSFPLHN
jgi:hypothetical protein